MNSYKQALEALNAEQRLAVTTTEGPLLVLAGPGTGKTQLLSTRAAHIVAQGNANPSDILCITYTEAGAAEMRLRLSGIMGNAGGEVAVHTFHSFGSWLIARYPEKFNAVKALKPLDDLARFKLFESLLANLPLRHPLAIRDADERFLRQGSVVEAIRVYKQAGLDPQQLSAIMADNEQACLALQPMIDELFGSTLSSKRLPAIQALVQSYAPLADKHSLAATLLRSLEQAIDDSQASGKTAPLGKWRTSYTEIKQQKRVFKSAARQPLLEATIQLYKKYQMALKQAGLFDYEDMVLWTLNTLNSDDDLRLEIAERFQYIMVDEYQDTNGAQNQLLDVLLDANPLHSPNIMVVGDDDQAIMRFQGAEMSGLLGFVERYQPTIVTLRNNYRSTQSILDVSRHIMTQTNERLEANLPELGVSKQLVAQQNYTTSTITELQATTPSAQYMAVAEQIQALLAEGVLPTDIAVIGRKHHELTAFSGYALSQGIRVNYERRENILEQQDIIELLALAQYLTEYTEHPGRAALLLPTVLRADYWQLKPLELYELAATAKAQKQTWLEAMFASDNADWQARAAWLDAAAQQVAQSNFTTAIDLLIGRQAVQGTQLASSPFATYLAIDKHPERYTQLLSRLLALRQAVLTARPDARNITDLLATVSDYHHSGLALVDNNPLLRGDDSGITLVSAHGAKGREFAHVFVLSVVDNVWGNRARGHNQRIHLPENLPLYPAGDTEADRLRLLYVATTRAKSHLYLATYTQTDDGKAVVPLSYLQAMPTIKTVLAQPATTDTLEVAWRPAPTTPARTLQETLTGALKHFRLTPTALRSFLDICYAGPTTCIERSVLGFPSAYNAHSALGSAAHRALQQAQHSLASSGTVSHEALLKNFDQALEASGLVASELDAVREHGHQFLPRFVDDFIAKDFKQVSATEQALRANLTDQNIPFSGVMDAVITNDDGSIRVIDYKTGKPPLPNWQTTGLSDSKRIALHFYRQQLLCYRLLVAKSTEYAGQTFAATELLFVEPSDSVDVPFVRLSITDFSAEELHRTEQLIIAVYTAITQADLPDISGYQTDLRGIEQFEVDLIKRYAAQ